jgi:hypothetical protein
MKTLNTLLLAGAVTFGFTLANSASADVLLSPRAKANQSAVAPRSASERNLVSGNYAGAALKAQSLAHSVVTNSGNQPSLVSGNYAGAAVKNPAAPSAQFQIAPIVGKGK